MFYPEEFKAKVKQAFPDWEELHRKLDEGDMSVGTHLYNSAPQDFPVDMILAATSLEDLQEKARVAKEKGKLFKEWLKLDYEQRINRR